MKLTLQRKIQNQKAVIGVILVNGKFECYSMERPDVIIPAGSYPVEITYSPHFHKPMPLLDAVPGRTGIRIHPANWPMQLEGCIAVGQSYGEACLNNSEKAFDPLFLKIFAAIQALENVTIDVMDNF